MEGDDAAITGIAFYIVEDILSCHPFGIVARDKVPHDDLVLSSKERILWQSHPAVGGTEKMALDVGVGFLYVIAIFVERAAQAADVIVGVIPYLVSFVEDTPIEFRVFTDVIADHEEGGVDAMLLQCVEDKGSGFGDWTIVEGQVY